jgi:hypothetical protein
MTMADKSNYDAFISYSHADCGTIAPAIHTGLQTIGRPWYKLTRNLNIFRDEFNLRASPGLWSAIEAALKDSDYFIFFASPIAASSKWVGDEVSLWSSLHQDPKTGMTRIFIVLTEGQLEWDYKKNDFNWKTTNCLPRAHFSGKFKEVPEWLDLRPYVRQSAGGKQMDVKSAGFVTAMTKIIGGITGKEPWQVESEERRSQRNTRRVRSGVIAILVILSLIVFMLYREAITQKDKAVSNLRQFKIEKMERDIRNGDVFLEAGEDSLAKVAFSSADSTIKDSAFAAIPAIKKRKQQVADALSKLL